MTVEELVEKCKGDDVVFRFYTHHYFLPKSNFLQSYKSSPALYSAVKEFWIDRMTYTTLVTITLEDDKWIPEEELFT